MYRHVLLLVSICWACSPKSSQADSGNLSFDGIEIPMEGTAIIGEITSLEKTDKGLDLTIKVQSNKQGGAGTAVFEKGSERVFFLSNNMMKIYKDQETLDDLMQTGTRLLFITTKDLRSGKFTITQIVTP